VSYRIRVTFGGLRTVVIYYLGENHAAAGRTSLREEAMLFLYVQGRDDETGGRYLKE